MIFRTLLFLVVMYFLVKIISRLFLPSNQKKQGGRGPSIFYHTFKQYSQQQQQNRDRENSGSKSRHFEEIEEAEFEEITDDEETASKSSD
jgi:hypothetical protein